VHVLDVAEALELALQVLLARVVRDVLDVQRALALALAARAAAAAAGAAGAGAAGRRAVCVEGRREESEREACERFSRADCVVLRVVLPSPSRESRGIWRSDIACRELLHGTNN